MQPEHSSSARSIFVDCTCGQRFKARADLVGKTVRCSSCGQPLVVRAAMVVDAPSPQEPFDLGTAGALDDPLSGYGTNTASATRMHKRRPVRPAANPLPVKTIAWVAGGGVGLVLIVTRRCLCRKMIHSAYREAVANTEQATATSDPSEDANKEPESAAITSHGRTSRDDAAETGVLDTSDTLDREQEPTSLTDVASDVLDAVTPDLSSPTAVYKHSLALTRQGRFEDLYGLYSENTRVYFDSHAAAEGHAGGREYFGAVLARIGKNFNYVCAEPEFTEKRSGNRCKLIIVRKGDDLIVATRHDFIREGVSWRFYSDEPDDLIWLAEEVERRAAEVTHRLAEIRRLADLERSVPSEQLRVLSIVHSNRDAILECSAISADGRFAACGANTGHVYVLDTTTQKAIADLTVYDRSSQGYGTWTLNRVAISAGGKRLVTCQDQPDRCTDLWDGSTGKHIARLQDREADCLTFSVDGRYLAAVFFSNLIVFEAETGKPAGEARPSGKINSVQFSPDAKSLAIGMWKGEFAVRRLSDGKEQLRGQIDGARSVVIAFSPNGDSVLTQASDKALTLWDISTGQAICKVQHDLMRVGPIAVMPDGVHATVMNDQCIDIWDLPKGDLIKRFRYTNTASSWSLSPYGTHGVLLPNNALSAKHVTFWHWSK